MLSPVLVSALLWLVFSNFACGAGADKATMGGVAGGAAKAYEDRN